MRAFVALLVVLATTLAFAEPPRSAVAPAAPDLLFFADKLATEIHTRCAGCHSDPEMAGNNFLLAPLPDPMKPDPEIVRRNFKSVLRFLDPHDPAASPLLVKILGGAAHGGGTVFASKTAPDYRLFVDFALGATLANRPPEAILARRIDVTAGEATAVDGTLSGDPDGNDITYGWRVLEAPPGGALRVEPGADGTASITATRAGVYRLGLRVHDGRLWSLPASALVVAAARPEAEPTPAAGAGTRRTGPTRKTLLDRRLDPHRLRLIRRLYFDLKWRTPRLEEIERWYEATHEEMVAAFLEDEEVWDIWYERQLFYFLLLDRFRPKDHPVTTIPQRLTEGRITVPRALQEIVRSQFFNARNPGNDTYVTVVLEQCLGLVVQERRNTRTLELGKKMYDGYKAKLFKQTGNSQADFVRIVFDQEEFCEHLLARTWEELQGSPIDKDRLKKDAARLHADPAAFRKILAEWLTGPAYVKGADVPRTKAEEPYVRALFQDTLDRLPTYEERRNVRNAFLSLADPTPIRLVMGRVLLESKEARLPESAASPDRFVKEQFLRLLGRQPTGRERDAFVKALGSDPRVTPHVVLWTLISSPEYQTY